MDIGTDFQILWEIGRALLLGVNPYSISRSYYPPATVYFFGFFGLFPFIVAFILLTLGNLSTLLYMLMSKTIPHKSLAWVLFTPAIYALGVGQIDLLFLGFFYLTEKKGWVSVFSAVLLTLKPQLAFIVLPWTLWWWLCHNRKYFLTWFFISLFIHLSPLLMNQSIYLEWWNSLNSEVSGYMMASPGFFSLIQLGFSPFYLLVPAIIIGLVGLRMGKIPSLILQGFILPYGYWYNLVMYIGYVPWKILVPVSWITFFLSYFLAHAFYPMTLIPLAAIGWLLFDLRQQQIKKRFATTYQTEQP